MPATVKGGFWPENGVSTLTTIHTTSSLRRLISQAFSKKSMFGAREIAETLNGAAVGAAALKQLTRVASAEELGGVRAIETETFVNRNTTAADRDDINADMLSLSTKTYDPTPVPNLDGNPLGTR